MLALLACALSASVLQGTVVNARRVPAATTRADFDRDGYADLAIGIPFQGDGPGDSGRGRISVLYGSRAGVDGDRDQRFGLDTPGIEGTASEFDQFGSAVATGDFDGDGNGDLAVRAANEDTFGNGAVSILYGTAGGLAVDRNQLIGPESPGVPTPPGFVEHFGRTLATGDFDGDGFDDLAIGIPGQEVSLQGAGAVLIAYGSATGIVTDRSQLWTRASPGIRGPADDADQFGWALATANFGRGPQDDLAVGTPVGVIPTRTPGGAVSVLFGSAQGITAEGNQLLRQGMNGVPGSSEDGDRFGFALAAGRLGSYGRIGLAIGAPNEALSGLAGAGTVTVLFATPNGLTGVGAQLWTQGSRGVEDGVEQGDRFGSALAVGNFRGDRWGDDLAIGVPWEDSPTARDAGAVAVLFNCCDQTTSVGVRSEGDQLWTQASPGIQDDPADAASAPDAFGSQLTAANYGFDRRADLAVGVPLEDLGAIVDAGAVHVIYGDVTDGLTASGNRFLSQDSPGIQGAAALGDWFGIFEGKI